MALKQVLPLCSFHQMRAEWKGSGGVCVSGGLAGLGARLSEELGQVLVGGVDPTIVLPTGHWSARGQGDPMRGPPGLGPEREAAGTGNARSADPAVGYWGPERWVEWAGCWARVSVAARGTLEPPQYLLRPTHWPERFPSRPA